MTYDLSDMHVNHCKICVFSDTTSRRRKVPLRSLSYLSQLRLMTAIMFFFVIKALVGSNNGLQNSFKPVNQPMKCMQLSTFLFPS